MANAFDDDYDNGDNEVDFGNFACQDFNVPTT